MGGIRQRFSQYLPAWNLADLSYIAIKNSNDYRSATPTLDDVYRLNNILLGIAGELARKRKGAISSEGMKLHILFGLSQKQFWYQEMTWQGNLLQLFEILHIVK